MKRKKITIVLFMIMLAIFIVNKKYEMKSKKLATLLNGISGDNINRIIYLNQYENYCNISRSKLNLKGDEQLCPCISKDLIGKENPIKHNRPVGKNIASGGSWSPKCLSWQNVAIIIPFRDREKHLSILLNVLHPFLQRQQIQYRFFVVEQSFPDVFNKASMMNVGFVEANATDVFDCFIFHDVDMLPEDDHNFYTCADQPLHLGAYVNKFNYKLSYSQLFGGVTAFRRWHFEKVNGFSNQFYGWGGEDDEMAARIKASKMAIERRSAKYSRYFMIPHGADRHNPKRKDKDNVWNIDIKKKENKLKEDGLSNLQYNITEKRLLPLYTWLMVNLSSQTNSSLDV